MVLWSLMIVNNWAVTEEGIVIAFHQGTSGTRWSMLYFYLWYFVIVIVVSNIVTAFLLEDFEVTQAQIIEIENNYEPEWRRHILEAARDLRVKERTTWNVTRKEHPYHAYERMFADEIREHIRQHDSRRMLRGAGAAARAKEPERDERYFVDSDDEAFAGPRLRQRPHWAQAVMRVTLGELGRPVDPHASSGGEGSATAGVSEEGVALAMHGVECPAAGGKGLRRQRGAKQKQEQGQGGGIGGISGLEEQGSDSESSGGEDSRLPSVRAKRAAADS